MKKILVNEEYNTKESALFELSFWENVKFSLKQGDKTKYSYQWRLKIYK
jgi:hypothetical protein